MGGGGGYKRGIWYSVSGISRYIAFWDVDLSNKKYRNKTAEADFFLFTVMFISRWIMAAEVQAQIFKRQ